jgi:hypothetical protein
LTKASLASGLRTWLLSGLTAVAFAGSAAAANLTDVRVGVHRDHTRIVLETDAKAPYVVKSGEREVVVHLDAAASAEAVTALSPHLIWAKVEPTEIGADVRLLLKQPADVRTMVLTGPHRIVLDLYPQKVALEPLPAPELLTAEAPAPTDVVPGPTPEELELADVESIVEPIEVPDVAPEELDEEVALDVEADVEPDIESELAEAAEDEMLASAEPSPEADATEARPAPQRAERPAPEPSPGTPFGSPLLLAAVAVAFFAVLLFLRRRLRSADKVTFPERFDEVPAPAEAPQRAVPVDAPSGAGESLFDVEADALRPLPKDEELLPRPRLAGPVTADETERRLAHLERRIEELVDARERLERQVAAQTEELRVQRAALARTPRVLRTVAPRTDEEPSGDPMQG